MLLFNTKNTKQRALQSASVFFEFLFIFKNFICKIIEHHITEIYHGLLLIPMT